MDLAEVQDCGQADLNLFSVLLIEHPLKLISSSSFIFVPLLPALQHSLCTTNSAPMSLIMA